MTMAQQAAVEKVAQFAIDETAWVVCLNFRSRAFDDVAVGNAGGAGGLATETSEAAIDVLDERGVNGEAAFVYLENLVDASTRRIGFESEDAIGWALLQAEPTVDAGGIKLPRGLIGGREVRLPRLFDWSGRAQSRNLPRLRLSFGLRARLAAAMEFVSLGDAPQTLMLGLSAAGQRLTTAEASRGSVRRSESTALT